MEASRQRWPGTTHGRNRIDGLLERETQDAKHASAKIDSHERQAKSLDLLESPNLVELRE
jgi:hypothetical protein